MAGDRRSFLKIAGLTILGVSSAKATSVLAQVAPTAATDTPPAAAPPVPSGPSIPNPSIYDGAITGKKWAMVIDPRKLQAPGVMDAAIEACHKAHNVPNFTDVKEEVKWIWKEDYKHAFPDQANSAGAGFMEKLQVLVLCNHCENPPCVRVCPTQATWKRESDGIVMMDMHRCIGCRFCMAACPYGSRSFNWKNPRHGLDMDNLTSTFPTRSRGVVEKCNFCAERLARGQQPSCVEAVGNGAIAFGDLGDPNSEVSKLVKKHYTIKRKPTLGTEPMVFYIIS
jgi:[DsrC]-trisulfide reductase subunit O